MRARDAVIKLLDVAPQYDVRIIHQNCDAANGIRRIAFFALRDRRNAGFFISKLHCQFDDLLDDFAVMWNIKRGKCLANIRLFVGEPNFIALDFPLTIGRCDSFALHDDLRANRHARVIHELAPRSIQCSLAWPHQKWDSIAPW